MCPHVCLPACLPFTCILLFQLTTNRTPHHHITANVFFRSSFDSCFSVSCFECSIFPFLFCPPPPNSKSHPCPCPPAVPYSYSYSCSPPLYTSSPGSPSPFPSLARFPAPPPPPGPPHFCISLAAELYAGCAGCTGPARRGEAR